MYARRVLQGSGKTAMCVNKGQPISQTPQCDKGPVNNLNHSIGATWHVPGKKICVSKLPMHKSSIQSCLFLHTHTMYGFTALVISFMLCSKPTLYLRPLVVDLSSCAKYGRPYWAWSAPSITVLIASVDAAACALLKWYMPRSSLTYNYKHHHTHVRCNRWGTEH